MMSAITLSEQQDSRDPLHTDGPVRLAEETSREAEAIGCSDGLGPLELELSLKPPPPAEPPLTHTLHQAQSSVLSLAADERWIFSGSQGMDIYVWDRSTFRVSTTLVGHTGSVLALEVSPEKKWLFSSSGDSTIRIWSTESLTPLYILTSYADSAGDIFSLTFSSSIQTLFFGCQNTSLQFFDFSENSKDLEENRTSTTDGDISGSVGYPRTGTPGPARKPHKFFDSVPKSMRAASTVAALSPVSVIASPSPPPVTTPQRQGAPTPQHTPPKAAYSTLPIPISPGAHGSSTPNSVQSSGSNSPSGTPKPIITALAAEGIPTRTTSTSASTAPPSLITVPERNMVPSAHFGYIYCISVVDGSWNKESNTEKAHLVTGSGDEDVKLWEWIKSGGDQSASVNHLHTFHGGIGAVLSLISRNGNLYAGCQDGHVKIWDLDTKTLVRTIIAQQNVDVLSLSMLDSDLYTASANGWIHRYSASFECTASWKGHSGIALSSIIVPAKRCPNNKTSDRFDLVTGASDNCIKLWSMTRPPKPRTAAEDSEKTLQQSISKRNQTPPNDSEPCIDTSDTMILAISQFVSFPSVSNHERHKEDCRQAARWLKNCFTQLGGESQLLYGVEGKNPLVMGTFRGSETRGPKRRILFYGHYDVIAAGSHSGWMHDPYSLAGLNGYLYGRGVSDNKGPILAVACAASEMLAKRSLNVDLVMLIEGEEEAGSAGFEEAVIKHKDQIGHIDSILVSNSYWIDEVSPCITYGLRGVVHATIEINSGRPDVHSGVEGGGSTEPMIDMVKLLSKLSDGPKINLPGFYDDVRLMSKEETESYELLAKVTGRSATSFSSRWREPSFSIHSVHDSGPGNSTIIPAHVRAKVSVRLVPDQDLATIVTSLEECVKKLFETLGSPNELKFYIDKTADWWLGELDDVWFKTLESAVQQEWGVQPLRIREGGSIPSIPFLEKEFKCHALHLPMGQSTDQAHLRNERISLNNLRKGRAVIERFLGEIPEQSA